MSNDNTKKLESQQDISQTIPCYSYPFQVTLQNGIGKRKDKIDLKFISDPPLDVLDMLEANSFHYDKNLDVWFSNNNYVSRQIADDVLRRSLLSKPIISKDKSGSLFTTPYKAKIIVPISSRIHPVAMEHQKIFKDVVNQAIKTIEQIHGIDVICNPIPIKLVKKIDGYAAEFWEEPLEILVSTNESPRVLTIVHEIGHYLDYSLGERINDWRWKLMTTIKRTTGYKTHKNFDSTRMGKVIITDKNGTKERLLPMKDLDPGRKYRIELCSDSELFARAYEQYIGMKSGQLISELEPETENRLELISGDNVEVKWNALPILWKNDDFVEVENLLDFFFTEIGWSVTKNK